MGESFKSLLYYLSPDLKVHIHNIVIVWSVKRGLVNELAREMNPLKKTSKCLAIEQNFITLVYTRYFENSCHSKHQRLHVALQEGLGGSGNKTKL